MMGIMDIIEKRKFIYRHLHQIDENFINEVYQKMHLLVEGKDPIVGYRASGVAITKSQFIADIKEAEKQIERGESITLDDLEKESETWV
jgi:hypothetical protein